MQVAPAELEAILIGHPEIIDTAVIPYVAMYLINHYFLPTPHRKQTRTQIIDTNACKRVHSL